MVAILSTFRELGRLQQIYMVLMRHGFGEIALRLGLGAKAKEEGGDVPQLEADAGASADGDGAIVKDDAPGDSKSTNGKSAKEKSKGSMAVRARLVAMDLGPSFVKLGQIASTRTDLLPKEWIKELKKLQDDVKPLTFEEIKKAVEDSLGAPLDQLYVEFNESPLAAASIGQVHRAKYKDDEGVVHEVVVKIQRPGVRPIVARDLEILHHLAKLLERTIPESRTYQPCGLVEQFDKAITNELDYTLEAENIERFRRNFAGFEKARFPGVFKAASSKSVLTLEFLPGAKIYDVIEKEGFSGETIAKTALGVIIKMVFEDGFFHADPHPGNILISGSPEAPVIGLVDLGMVGRLSNEMRERLIDMMVAAVRKDPDGLADALYAMGTPTKRVDMKAFRGHVAELSDKYLGKPLKEIDFSSLINDLVKGAQKFGLEIPSDFLLVGKALVTIEGVGKEIYPDLDLFTEGRPQFIALLKKRYSPERIGNEILRGLGKVSSTAYDLPQVTHEVLDDLRLGRLAITTSDAQLPTSLDRLGRRVFSGLVVSAFVASGAALVTTSQLYVGITLMVLGGLIFFGHLALDTLKRWKA
ncbi:MAG: AarF/ABC1/UbiB kinase family protein [Polyangiaceae bacterium]